MLRRLLHNWQLKLLAVAIALALWIFVVGQEKAEITVKVPVEITNIPKQVVVAGDVVPAVNVRLFGPRSLTRRVAEKRMAKNVSLTGMRPGEHSYQVLPEDLDLPPGVRLVRSNPASFTVVLKKRQERQVPVRPVIKGKPAKGFEVGEVVFKPAKVTISGAEDQVGDVDWIWTTPLDVTGLKKGMKLSASLKPPADHQLSLALTKVEARVAIRPIPKKTRPAAKAPASAKKTKRSASPGGTGPINP